MARRAHGDVIPVEAAVTLDGLFRERVKRTPDLVAYRYFDEQHGALARLHVGADGSPGRALAGRARARRPRSRATASRSCCAIRRNG